MELWIFITKGVIFAALLIYASVKDIRTREVDDYLSVMIAITALIGVTLADLPFMLAGALFVPLPLFIAALLRPGRMGGADIKLMAASAFLLGLRNGMAAMITGLALAVIFTLIISKIRKNSAKDSFPLVPYLGAGCILAYTIF